MYQTRRGYTVTQYVGSTVCTQYVRGAYTNDQTSILSLFKVFSTFDPDFGFGREDASLNETKKRKVFHSGVCNDVLITMILRNKIRAGPVQ